MKFTNRKIRYRLIIPQELVQTAFAGLAMGRFPQAFGRIYRSYRHQSCDLIVRRMKFSRNLRTGDQHSPLYDWLFMDSSQIESRQQMEERIANSRVRPGQLMVYFQPGKGDNLANWIGAVVQSHSIEPLDEIITVGPGLPGYQRRNEFTAITDAQTEDQWSRMKGALGSEVLNKFHETPVLLVGAGRLGSLLATTFVRNGLKRITIVDPDMLESHNRDATFGNRPKDTGKSKSVVLAKHLHRIRPTAVISAIQTTIQDPTAIQLLRDNLVVITCTDNDQSRRHVSRLCSEFVRVHLDIGTIVRVAESEQGNQAQIGADIRLMLPGSCLACVGGLEREAANQPDRREWNSGQRIGSLTSINHLAIGAAQQIYFDFLASAIQSSFWQRIAWNSQTGIIANGNSVSGDSDCELCQSFNE